MKRLFSCILAFLLLLTGCQASPAAAPTPTPDPVSVPADATEIVLSDDGILVDGDPISGASDAPVYAAKDIIFYPTGQDFTYGEGTEADAHEQAEADEHTVVHIARAGTYSLSGTLSKGQIAVDLGEDAEENPDAVVTLILSGMELTCTVAPGVIFYNVYECCSDEEEDASATVDTAAAGANVILADGTENTVNGSYVARIYEPGTVELSEDGTEVLDADKLHKYDAAFYSKQTMNVSGGEAGTGVLNIRAENEGLDSELHLTLNGGNVNIVSGNDGINTNEDGVSVTTINGGTLSILVSGETGEGDGIDSNGWLVINGGTVRAMACDKSADSGIDSDLGIYLNGGSVMASGNMLDQIAGGESSYAVFSFAQQQSGGNNYTLKDATGAAVLECTPENGFSTLLLADAALTPGDYTFWQGETQLTTGGAMGGGRPGMQGGEVPEGFTPGKQPELPDGMEFPEAFTPGERPEMPEGMEPPEGFTPGERPDGGFGGRAPGSAGSPGGEETVTFSIRQGGSLFSGVAPAAADSAASAS